MRRTTALGMAAGLAIAAGAQAPHAGQRITAAPMDLASYYGLGEFEAVESALTRAATGHLDVILDGFRQDAEAWIGADGPDWAPRRRLVVATVALEAANAGLDSQWVHSKELVQWACGLLGEHPAQPAERDWHLAAIAIIEGAGDTGLLSSHLQHVRSRFPDEPRLLLAEAFDDEFRYLTEVMWYGAEHGAGRRTAMFDEALAHPDTAREAHLRLGFMLLQGSRFDEAVAHLRQVDPPDDPGQMYLARLFEGWAHQRRDPPDLAVAERAFLEAIDAVPGAYAASLSLALLLYPTERRIEADEVMRAVATADPPVADPWRIYGYGDLRRWPLLIERLRGALR